MRLQLDTATTGTESVRSNEISQPASSGAPAFGSTQSGGGVSGARDSVEISGASSALNQLNADRAERVQQLTSAVQSGAYQVPSAQVSSAIVSHALS